MPVGDNHSAAGKSKKSLVEKPSCAWLDLCRLHSALPFALLYVRLDLDGGQQPACSPGVVVFIRFNRICEQTSDKAQNSEK